MAALELGNLSVVACIALSLLRCGGRGAPALPFWRRGRSPRPTGLTARSVIAPYLRHHVPPRRRRLEGERLRPKEMRASSISPRTRPCRAHERKSRQGHARRYKTVRATLSNPFSHCTFRRTSFACQRKIPDSPGRDFSPVPASYPQRTCAARTEKSISQIPTVVGKKMAPCGIFRARKCNVAFGHEIPLSVIFVPVGELPCFHSGDFATSRRRAR